MISSPLHQSNRSVNLINFCRYLVYPIHDYRAVHPMSLQLAHNHYSSNDNAIKRKSMLSAGTGLSTGTTMQPMRAVISPGMISALRFTDSMVWIQKSFLSLLQSMVYQRQKTVRQQTGQVQTGEEQLYAPFRLEGCA